MRAGNGSTRHFRVREYLALQLGYFKQGLVVGIFDSVICTGQFKDAYKSGHEVVTKLSKAQV